MSTRDDILSRVRKLTAGGPAAELPPVAEVWPRQNPPAGEMADRFAAELNAVHGETIRCGSMAEAQAVLARLMADAGATRLAALDRPACREITAVMPTEQVAWAAPDWTPAQMEKMPLGLVAAEHLLADTGTAMIVCNRPEERLMCYLPPFCVVVGRTSQVAEHLSAVWEKVAAMAAEPDRRGEFVFVTGPSRTADIEKILILGVHGPKRLVVLLVD